MSDALLKPESTSPEKGEKYQPTERRPIASRNLRIVREMASALVRLKVSPNMISIAGMICALAAGLVFAATTWWPEGQRAGVLAVGSGADSTASPGESARRHGRHRKR
jgi:hypothetical protein